MEVILFLIAAELTFHAGRFALRRLRRARAH